MKQKIAPANGRLTRQRHRGPKPDTRRALELLAASPDGCTEAIMPGFTVELVELVRAGLAFAKSWRRDRKRMMRLECIGAVEPFFRLLRMAGTNGHRRQVSSILI
jgi:hypothetical protein